MKTIPQLALDHRAEDRKKRATQREVTEFVAREVYVNQTSLVDELLSTENVEVSWDEVVNLEYTEAELLENGYSQDQIDTGDAQSAKEIMEWWVVSDRLADKLEERGEPILKSDFGTWWGRCCSGQAIMLDAVIEDIYSSLNK